eukprot:Clim_evm53s33 gene=Clim_evmTU53s33
MNFEKAVSNALDSGSVQPQKDRKPEVRGNLDNIGKDVGNDQELEEAWARKAFLHAENYDTLLKLRKGSTISLTDNDNEIIHAFREEFPDLDVKNLKDSDLKSDAAKEKWRKFSGKVEAFVDDHNYGTLLRLTAEKPVDQDNSILHFRSGWVAIEAVRNREGMNDHLYVGSC